MKRTKLIIREYTPTKGATEQEIWLCGILNRSGMYAATLGRKCHISRQHIYNLMYGVNKLTFPMVCAICYVTGLDDPEEVWNALSL